MTPEDFEVLEAAIKGRRSYEWFKNKSTATSELARHGLIEDVEMHQPPTGSDERKYQGTAKGRSFYEEVVRMLLTPTGNKDFRRLRGIELPPPSRRVS